MWIWRTSHKQYFIDKNFTDKNFTDFIDKKEITGTIWNKVELLGWVEEDKAVELRSLGSALR